ncbi:hypothetical protein HOY82DRAFT_536683 [Tuber indicum]|nr:hypothetical protein HOY82DRAFT_536683 [Tuber indicum]
MDSPPLQNLSQPYAQRQHNSLPCIQLVLADDAGVACPLPAELGSLPLYPVGDGFYSVLGPPLSYTTPGEAQANEAASANANNALAYYRINISATLTPPRGVVRCGSSRCSGNRFAPLQFHVHPSQELTRRSGPHTCSRRSYTCNAPDCPRLDPFKTKQALNRHYRVIHLGERHDCPVPGCESVGENGIKRFDNLVAHLRNKHGALPSGGSHGDWLIPRVVG